jgi:chaperonin GroEL
MIKKALYGKEAREKILGGVRKICAAVKVTLGPSGRNVLISQSMIADYSVHNLPIHLTKDGYTTARSFDVEDYFEKAGVVLVKEAAQKTVDQAGDGTTSTCVLLEAIAEAGIKLIDEGANPMELKKIIDAEVQTIVESLQAKAIKIGDDNERVFQVASISANNDPVIGRTIADAFKEIGHEGIIDLEAGQSVTTEIKIAKGYRFERSWVSPLFINNKEKQICEFENPLILLYEKRVIHHTQVQRALELAIAHGRPVLIICEDAGEEGLAFLAMNTLQGRVKCCVVKSPGIGERRRQDMEDIAILTSGTYISDGKGIDIKEMEFENFGQAKKVLVTKEETVIIGGLANKGEVEDLLNELRMNLTQAKNEDEAAPIEKRIAKLQGGVAVIQVGAATETEMKEKLDRYDDAVRATKSAISEGYLPGAGTAFLKARPHLQIDLGEIEKMTPEDIFTSDEVEKRKCFGVVYNILRSPLLQICANAGIDGEKILNNVLLGKENHGYNAKTGKVEDLLEAGVIDPVKVLRCSLQNAASAAGAILTTECLIADFC